MKKKLSSISNNFRILFKFVGLCSRFSKNYVPLALLLAFFKAIIIIPNIVFSKFIIDALINKNEITYILKLVLGYILCNAFIKISNCIIKYFTDLNIEKLLYQFENEINDNITTMKFENVEDPEVLNMKESVLHAINNERVFEKVINTLSILLIDIINMIILVLIVASFNILILVPVLLIIWLNSKNFSKLEKLKYESNQNAIPINRGYIYNIMLTMDFSKGKDIRANNCSNLVLSKMKKYNDKTHEIFSWMYKSEGKYNGINKVNLQIQMAAVYIYVAYEAIKNVISIGEFTMYVGAVNEFSKTLISFINTVIEINQLCNYLKLFYDFQDISRNENEGSKEVVEKSDFVIEFQNVSFKYPRSDKYVIRNISLKIQPQTNITIVGENGAGKTTLIKLLTRLYEPTEGRILFNGKDISLYCKEDFNNMISVVFQDFKLFSLSVKENIALKENVQDDSKVVEAINKVGIGNVIAKFKNGVDTQVYKNLHGDGIEFSGGQAQLLAIARAIYKDAPIAILDEPTAALDAIAEQKIYSKFNEISKNKTTIFISHRLSSCQFSDVVLVLHEGRVIQYGNHKTLLEDKNGLYAKMYKSQAQYYT